MKLLNGEERAIERLKKDAANYGYGNFIAILKREWIDVLVKEYGMTEEQATRGADVSAYPRDFP